MFQDFRAPCEVRAWDLPVRIEVDVKESVRDAHVAVARLQPRGDEVGAGVARDTEPVACEMPQEHPAAAPDVQHSRILQPKRVEHSERVTEALVDRPLAREAEIRHANSPTQKVVNPMHTQHRTQHHQILGRVAER